MYLHKYIITINEFKKSKIILHKTTPTKTPLEM